MDEQREGVIQSVRSLRGLNGALIFFLRRWDALQKLVDSIDNSIEARSRELDDALSDPPPPVRPPPQAEKANGEEKKKEEEGEEGGAAAAAPKNPHSELEHICDSMGSRALRRYVTRHLSEVDRLREDVPVALRRAPDPARLVLDCAGRFYRQGSRAYDRPDSPMAAIRRACILVLEFYLLSGCLSSSTAQIDLAEIAREAALDWRARLVSEGGVASAGAVDALGLVLFLASFGIPLEFGCGDLYDLLRLCNLEKKAHVFRRSPFLLEKMPDIIKDMVSKDMYVEAVDLICAFGLEEKFPPLSLLSPFLDKTKQVATEERKGHCPAKEASEKQLAVLKSVAKCLEVHKLDSSGLGFDLDQRIAKLEKDIMKGEQELKDKNLKRKAEVAGHSNKPETRAKRPGHAAAESPHGIPRHLIKQTQAQGNTALSDSQSFYNDVQPRNMLDGRFTGFLDGNSTGSTAGNVLGGAGVGSWLGAAAGGSLTNSIGGPYRSHESLIGHRLFVLPPSAGNSMEKGLMGLSPNAAQGPTSSLGTGSRSSVSSLYKFADTVLEQELHYNHSSRGYVVPTATPGSHSSSYFN